MEHLIHYGHRKILLLNGPEHLPSSQHFKKGYLKTLEAFNLPIREDLIKYNPISIEHTCTQLKAIFSGGDTVNPEDFTAILTLSDVIAIGVYEAALQYGFCIPDRYSVVGYDNILATKYLNPALTTLHQPKEQTGLFSINLLLDQINKDMKEHIQIILSAELIIRDSVRSLLP